MVGDADPAMMEELIADRFGGWRGKGPAPAEPDYGRIAKVTQPIAISPIRARRHLANLSWVRPYKPMPHTKAREEVDFARRWPADPQPAARGQGADRRILPQRRGQCRPRDPYRRLYRAPGDGPRRPLAAGAQRGVRNRRRCPRDSAERGRGYPRAQERPRLGDRQCGGRSDDPLASARRAADRGGRRRRHHHRHPPDPRLARRAGAEDGRPPPSARR